MFRFCELGFSHHPSYKHVLASLKDPSHPSKLLDVGCCFAQDIRKLVYDGAPAENLYACDLRRQFLDLGYDLYGDTETLKAHIFATDIFQDGGRLEEMEGKMDFLHVRFFLHMFNWEKQVEACKRMVKLLKAVRGAMILGSQTANVKGHQVNHPAVGDLWRHDETSFKKMWELVGQATGTRWSVWTEFKPWKGLKFDQWTEPGFGYLTFEVKRES